MLRKHKYMAASLAVFFTVCAILLFYDTLFGRGTLLRITRQFLHAIQPVLYGAFIAYLLEPMVDFFERRLFPRVLAKARERGRPIHPAARAVTLLLIWVVIVVAVYLLGSVLLPELYRSLLQLLSNIEVYYNTVAGWITDLLESNPTVEKWVASQLNIYYDDLMGWITGKLMPQAQQLMTALSGGVVSVVSFFTDLLVGIIVSVYLLATKEQMAAHARKVVCSLFSRKNAPWVFRAARKVDRIFSGFVRGKLLDSLIIGLICFGGCTIFNFPYTPLVSVIVGVPNMIPFFGPFLGAIPSLFLILLVSPLKAVYFLLFILALQQLDGNIIGPLILGDKTGLSSLWVIAAILVGGSFFGLAGMFFGVPVCACLYSAATFFIEVRLRKRG
ncbi:MAG: AI-2E family transporter, partial [Clostridiales bacterium]|nr:AI-2E family transporter [Clostridiales bacterium]